ncbi:MAG TPA: ImmA/IrrE family metallo-endopeptidase [Kofleriaceae bacterium]|nr:ImmA/IrrE family metallo-endopeptidase [Kofleriaceae bacterium]
MELRFEDDPDGGEDCAREEAATWGAFRIWVRGTNVCAHLEEGEIVPSIHWYLIGLLEWFANSWEPLLHEEKLPGKNSAEDAWDALEKTAFPPLHLESSRQRSWEQEWAEWRARHALQTAREGGLFPDLVFRRWRDRIEISWGDAVTAGAPAHYRFLSERGVERLAPKDIAEPLYGVLTSAVEFLMTENPGSARIKALKKTLDQVPSTALDNRLAWLVGLGRTKSKILQSWGLIESKLDEIPRGRQALLSSATLSGSLAVEGTCQAALMFGSASPTLQQRDVMKLAGLAIKAYAPRLVESKKLRALVRDEPPASLHEEDYEYGYRLAEETLEDATIRPDDAVVDLQPVLSRLKIKTVEIELTDTEIRAISIASPHHQPTIAINRRHRSNSRPFGLRFTLAHELCHILFDRSAGQQLALISGPWAPIALERRANAFAAMLLMPSEIVRRILAELTVREDSAEGIHEIAGKLHASPIATLEHVANLQRWDIATRDRVRGELVEQPQASPGSGAS